MTNLLIDIHCHLLPQVDDGPTSLEESLELCQALVQDGITHVVATPHMLNGTYNTTNELILKTLAITQEHVRQLNIPLNIYPGADIHVSSDLDKYLKNNKVMTVCNARKYFLLELPNNIWPSHLSDLLFRIQLLGITPILTHPERYRDVQRDITILDSLIERGVPIQITAAGITGEMGKTIQECSKQLFLSKRAHLVATDSHSVNKRPPRMLAAMEQVRSWVDKKEFDLIFLQRPKAILEGKYIALEKPKEKKLFWFFAI